LGLIRARTGFAGLDLVGSGLRPGTPAVAKFLGYSAREFGKNHLGDHVEALPTAYGLQEF
jgi:hypothetical protein